MSLTNKIFSGKTHVSRSIERYIRWLGVKVGTFSLGDYRRKTLGRAKDLPFDYFLPGEKSEKTNQLRNKVVNELQDTISDFFVKDGGQVLVYYHSYYNYIKYIILARFMMLIIQQLKVDNKF